MSEPSAFVNRKPDPDCEQCGGRGVISSPDYLWAGGTLKTRCPCTDPRPPEPT